MKKKNYSSAVAMAALLSASSIALAGGPEIIPVEDYFSGFYIGGTGAVHHADFEGNTTVELTDPVTILTPLPTVIQPGVLSSSDLNGQSVDGYGGVQGGFGWTFNHIWYLGVQGYWEGGSNIDSTSVNKTLVNFDAFNGTVTDVATSRQTLKFRLSSNGGVAAKLGYVVAPRTMLYGKIGAEWAEFHVTNSAEITNDFTVNGIGVPIANVHTSVISPETTDEDTKVGLLLAVGFEQFIWADWISLNFEYDYVNYGSVSTDRSQFASTTTATFFGCPTPITVAENVLQPLFTSSSADAHVNSFLAGVNFYFGRNWF